MFAADAARLRQEAEAAAVEAAWAQWASITAAALPTNRQSAWTLVDPEALVLASLLFAPAEARLFDLAAGFARVGGSLLSVSRLKRMAKALKPNPNMLAAFAAAAIEAGHKQWASVAATAPSTPDRGKDVGPLRLVEGPALMLRLRAGFGVTGKADLLAFLLGLGEEAGLRMIASSLVYSDRAIRTAAEEMATARFLDRNEGPPVSYSVDAKRWAAPLRGAPKGSTPDRAGIPPWHDWRTVFLFLADLSAWAGEVVHKKWSEYVAGSRARDLAEKHERLLRLSGGDLALRESTGSADYLPAFVEAAQTTIRVTEIWLAGALLSRMGTASRARSG